MPWLSFQDKGWASLDGIQVSFWTEQTPVQPAWATFPGTVRALPSPEGVRGLWAAAIFPRTHSQEPSWARSAPTGPHPWLLSWVGGGAAQACSLKAGVGGCGADEPSGAEGRSPPGPYVSLLSPWLRSLFLRLLPQQIHTNIDNSSGSRAHVALCSLALATHACSSRSPTHLFTAHLAVAPRKSPFSGKENWQKDLVGRQPSQLPPVLPPQVPDPLVSPLCQAHLQQRPPLEQGAHARGVPPLEGQRLLLGQAPAAVPLTEAAPPALHPSPPYGPRLLQHCQRKGQQDPLQVPGRAVGSPGSCQGLRPGLGSALTGGSLAQRNLIKQGSYPPTGCALIAWEVWGAWLASSKLLSRIAHLLRWAT